MVLLCGGFSVSGMMIFELISASNYNAKHSISESRIRDLGLDYYYLLVSNVGFAKLIKNPFKDAVTTFYLPFAPHFYCALN